MRRLFWAAGLFATAGLLCGCSSSMEPRSADEPQAAAVVTMGFHSFNPAEVTITVGQTVEWDNSSMIGHTVTCDASKADDPKDVAMPAGAQSFDSGKVESGHRFYHAFTVPGTYRYFCVPHESMGMLGVVVVKNAGG